MNLTQFIFSNFDLVDGGGLNCNNNEEIFKSYKAHRFKVPKFKNIKLETIITNRPKNQSINQKAKPNHYILQLITPKSLIPYI